MVNFGNVILTEVYTESDKKYHIKIGDSHVYETSDYRDKCLFISQLIIFYYNTNMNFVKMENKNGKSI